MRAPAFLAEKSEPKIYAHVSCFGLVFKAKPVIVGLIK